MIQFSVVKNEQFYPLLLADNMRPSIEEFEALFDFETAIKGGYSMNVKLPVEGNEVVLDHAHSAFLRDNVYYFNVIIYEREVPTYKGLLSIDKANLYVKNRFFDCDVIFQTFASSIKDRLLKDCLDKEIVLCNSLEDFSSDIQDFFIENNWPAAPVQFPEIRIIDNEDAVVVANQWNHVNQTFKNVATNVADFSNPTIPQPYYAEVLRELFRNYGYKVQGEIFEDDFFTRELMPSYAPAYFARRVNEIELVTTEDIVVNGRTTIEWGDVAWNTTLYNAAAPTTLIIDQAQQGSGFLQIVEVDLKIKTIDPGGKVRLYQANQGDDQSGVVDFWALDGDLITYTFWPQIYHGGTYLSRLDLAGVDNNYAPNELNTPDFPVTDNISFVLEKGSKIKQYFTQNFDLPEQRRYLRQSMNLNEMIPPSLLASEFLVAVKNLFQLKIDIDEVTKVVHISRASDLKKRPIEKLGNLLDGFEKDPQPTKRFKLKWANATESIKDLRSIGSAPNRESIAVSMFQYGDRSSVFIIAENAYYVRENNEWKFYSIRNDQLEYGDGENVVSLDLPVSLVEMRSDATGDAYGILPTLKSSSSGVYKGDEKEAWELMIMTYLGVQPNIGGKQKPFATSASTLYDGTPILLGHLILNFQENSVFTKYQKPLLDLLKSEAVYTFRCNGSYATLRDKMLRKILWIENNHYVEKARLGTIGTEESINKIELIRL